MKTCPTCRESLGIHAFGVTSRGGYELRCRACIADSRRIQKHGMTLGEKEYLAEQQGGCGICGRSKPGQKGWTVDHDRSCCPGDKSCEECRRGILCQWCNNVLGYAFDSPEVLRRAAEYVGLATRLLPYDWGQSTESVKRLSLVSHTDVTNETDGLRVVPTDVDQVTAVDARRASDGESGWGL